MAVVSKKPTERSIGRAGTYWAPVVDHQARPPGHRSVWVPARDIGDLGVGDRTKRLSGSFSWPTFRHTPMAVRDRVVHRRRLVLLDRIICRRCGDDLSYLGNGWIHLRLAIAQAWTHRAEPVETGSGDDTGGASAPVPVRPYPRPYQAPPQCRLHSTTRTRRPTSPGGRRQPAELAFRHSRLLLRPLARGSLPLKQPAGVAGYYRRQYNHPSWQRWCPSRQTVADNESNHQQT